MASMLSDCVCFSIIMGFNRTKVVIRIKLLSLMFSLKERHLIPPRVFTLGFNKSAIQALSAEDIIYTCAPVDRNLI